MEIPQDVYLIGYVYDIVAVIMAHYDGDSQNHITRLMTTWTEDHGLSLATD